MHERLRVQLEEPRASPQIRSAPALRSAISSENAEDANQNQKRALLALQAARRGSARVVGCRSFAGASAPTARRRARRGGRRTRASCAHTYFCGARSSAPVALRANRVKKIRRAVLTACAPKYAQRNKCYIPLSIFSVALDFASRPAAGPRALTRSPWLLKAPPVAKS